MFVPSVVIDLGFLNLAEVPVAFVEPVFPEPATVVTSGLSVFWSVAIRLTRYAWFLSLSVSLTPVRVTVCAVFQLPSVKVSVAGETVASPVSLLARLMVAFVSSSRLCRLTSAVTVPLKAIFRIA